MDDWQEIPLDSSNTPAAPAQAPSGLPPDAMDLSAGSMNQLPPDAQEIGPAVDNATGEPLPPGFDGTSPQSPRNASPLSALERFNLSMGNKQGNLNYLVNKYGKENVATVFDPQGTPTDDVSIRVDGDWYRVDPNNGDIRDPWELTQSYLKNPGEFVGDVADLGPLGIAAGVASAPIIQAGGIAAGTMAAAGAATAGITTSLGRIAGTYDATPLEQAWDIGFEGLMNAAGAKIAAGMKPTATWVSNQIPRLYNTFKDTLGKVTPEVVKEGGEALANSPKALYRALWATNSVGNEAFDTMLEMPQQLKTMMKTADQATGGKVAAYTDYITAQQVNAVKQLSNQTQPLLSKIYGKMRNKILKAVGGEFSGNFDEPIIKQYQDLISSNMGYIVQKVKTPEGIVELAVQGDDAIEALGRQGLQNIKFKMYTQDELAKLVRGGLELSDDEGKMTIGHLMNNQEAYDSFKNYIDAFQKFANSKERSGPRFAKDLLDFKKVMTDYAHSIESDEVLAPMKGVRSLLAQSRTNLDNYIRKSLDESGVADVFDEMNSTYNTLSRRVRPLIDTAAKAKRADSDRPYEVLFNQLTSRPGRNVTSKLPLEALNPADALITTAEKVGLGADVAEMLAHKNMVRLGEAAKSFNPLNPGEVKRAMSHAGAPAAVAISYATQNPAWLVVAALLKGYSSPKTAQVAANTWLKGQQMVSKMSSAELNKFLNSPQAMTMFTNALMQAPLIHAQTEEQLQNQINGLVSQPPPPAPVPTEAQ